MSLNNFEKAQILQKKMLVFGMHYDLHTCRASLEYNRIPSEITPEQRSVGKLLNFGNMHGMADPATHEAMGEARMAYGYGSADVHSTDK